MATDNGKLRVGLAALAILLLAWGSYAGMLGAYWRHDDFGWQVTCQQWEEGERSLWRGHNGFTPAYDLLYYALYRLAGHEPTLYWVAFISLHGLCSLLVAWLVWLLVRSPVAAVMAGAFFATHFAHHEAVGWGAATVHVLATALAVVSVGIYVIARRRNSVWLLTVSVLLALLSALSKESGAAVLALIAAAELLLPLPRSRSQRLIALAAFAAAAAVYALLRVAVGGTYQAGPGGIQAYWPGAHVLLNLFACVPQMILPDVAFSNYRAMLSSHLPAGGVSAMVLLSRVGILLIAALSVYGLVRTRGVTRFAIAWPYLAFLPMAPFIYEYALAPRYLYLPSVGLALLLGVGLRRALIRWPARRTWVFAVAALSVIINLAPLMVMQRNRLRDSRVRRSIALQLPEVLPSPSAGAAVYIRGLPEHFTDLSGLARMLYGRPVRVHPVQSGQAPARTHDYVLDYTQGRLTVGRVPVQAP